MWILWLLACKPKNDDVIVPTPPPEPCAWGPTQTWESNTAPATVRQAFRDERLALGAEGVAWAVLVDGEIRWAGANGEADVDVPMAPTTLLRSGSTLKMQTAAALLALEHQGLLDRSDTLADHLPDFSMALQPGLAEQATLHELISHQGGFYDYTPIDGPAGENALYNHAHTVFAEQYYLMVEPGSFYNYSNPNFAMAGLVAQEASGIPYRQLMHDVLWQPLCMERSFFEADDVLADGDYAMATTTNWTTGIGTERVGPGAYDNGFSAPAGFAWTSVLDMLHFAHFLLEGNEAVMPRALSDALTTPQVDTLDLPDGLIAYGYGVSLEPGYVSGFLYKDAPVWRHNGAIPGYSAEIVIHPESGVAVAVLSNADGAYFADGIGAVLDELTGAQSASPPANPWDAATFDRYAGGWDDPFNVGHLEITADGNALTLDAPDLEAAGVPYSTTLVPLGLNTFRFDVQGTQLVITFVDGPDGEPRWIRHRAFVVEKQGITTTSAPPPEQIREAVERIVRLEATTL